MVLYRSNQVKQIHPLKLLDLWGSHCTTPTPTWCSVLNGKYCLVQKLVQLQPTPFAQNSAKIKPN